MALTAREKQILRLKKGDLSDYEIARKLRLDAGNVTRSRKTALRKIERAQYGKTISLLSVPTIEQLVLEFSVFCSNAWF
jgi:DNA-binding NarL/FixJ family response regulator